MSTKCHAQRSLQVQQTIDSCIGQWRIYRGNNGGGGGLKTSNFKHISNIIILVCLFN
jgi:hypothetical protein